MRALLEALTLGPLLGVLLWVLTIWNRIPVRLPSHFGGGGKPDAWGTSGILLVELGMAIGIYVLIGFLERIPLRLNLPFRVPPGREEQLRPLAVEFLKVLKLVTVWLMLYLTVMTVLVGQGRREGLGSVVPIFLVLIPAVVVFYMVRMRRAVGSGT